MEAGHRWVGGGPRWRPGPGGGRAAVAAGPLGSHWRPCLWKGGSALGTGRPLPLLRSPGASPPAPCHHLPGARHITISTVGVPNAIQRLGRLALQSTLAVSIHAPTQVGICCGDLLWGGRHGAGGPGRKAAGGPGSRRPHASASAAARQRQQRWGGRAAAAPPSLHARRAPRTWRSPAGAARGYRAQRAGLPPGCAHGRLPGLLQVWCQLPGGVGGLPAEGPPPPPPPQLQPLQPPPPQRPPQQQRQRRARAVRAPRASPARTGSPGAT